MKAKDAINKAESSFKNPPKESLVGIDRVRLRHLWHALELVSGKDPVDALAVLHKALVSGRMKSQAVGTSGHISIIPANTWPELNLKDPENGWVTGVIYHEHHLPGFAGKLPTVGRKDAESWLKQFQLPPSVGRPSKQPRAADAYQQIYPKGHKAVGERWKHALAGVNRTIAEPVAEKTLQRAVKNSGQNPGTKP